MVDKKTCINCKYRDMDYSSEYPCCECINKSQWEDINYQPTAEDLIISELKNIKSEFEDKILLNQTVAIQIIDKRIAELKGE